MSSALRLVTALLLAIPHAAALAQGSGSSLTPFATSKAETMLRDHLPCLGCHQLGGEGGRIGPDLSTVRERRSGAYIAAMIVDPQRTAPGSVMPRTLMSDATRTLITRYLASRPGNAPGEGAGAAPAPSRGAPPVATPVARTTVPDGQALYARWCASCHGASGKGDGPNVRFLPVKPAVHADAKAESLRPDDSLYDTIAGGGAIMNRSPRMPAFGATLSPGEIRALVAHIRTLCRCQGPRWSRDGVGKS